jgi:hypothetical protein
VTPSSDSKQPKRTGKGATAGGRTERGRRSARATRETSGEERGIFANLPSTRPQRPSARRAAAKRAAAAATGPKPSTRASAAKGAARSGAAKSAGPASQPTRRDPAQAGSPVAATSASSKPKAKPKTTAAKRRSTTAGRVKPAAAKRGSAPPPPPPSEPAVPPQGFDGEGEIEPGAPVRPPSRPEVAGALAELVGDLAQTGLARGGKLVKEALGRLPGI